MQELWGGEVLATRTYRSQRRERIEERPFVRATSTFTYFLEVNCAQEEARGIAATFAFGRDSSNQHDNGSQFGRCE
jgi:hypothetical protein